MLNYHIRLIFPEIISLFFFRYFVSLLSFFKFSLFFVSIFVNETVEENQFIVGYEIPISIRIFLIIFFRFCSAL